MLSFLISSGILRGKSRATSEGRSPLLRTAKIAKVTESETSSIRMCLTRMQLLDFKNHEEVELDLCPQVNCLLGDNGTGKTNVLDAVHYLGNAKGYFNPIDSQNIRHGREAFLVEGAFALDDGAGEQTDRVACAVAKGQKKLLKRNGKAYSKLADHVGRYPVVMIAPADAELILDGSEVRRKWMDMVISQYDRPYLDRLMQYQHLVQQRNNLLRFFAENRVWDEGQLEPWDERMVPLAESIAAERARFLAEFTPEFDRIHTSLCKGRESVGMSLSTKVKSGEFGKALVEAREDDRRLRRSTVGVHKDDVLFRIGDHPLKRFGSQGQQKTFLLALRLAQVEHLARRVGRRPILLLDDIFDKIDAHRAGALMSTLAGERFGQVFISDTDPERIPALLRDAEVPFAAWHVTQDGVVAITEPSNTSTP
ncbi:MAG: DNA replication/repair protein RecF [Crocinitomicaceae bacterium TMED114]|nr:MAG: DNA replication/repair protein RecF [Crocinitomicaceae bacterium TMED114]